VPVRQARPAQPAAAPKPARRRGGPLDWVVGIVLGIVLGIAVVTAFVFLGAEDTIDAPSVSGEAAKPAKEAVPLTPSPRER
jgi:flagellar basal body-associated protein FliL